VCVKLRKLTIIADYDYHGGPYDYVVSLLEHFSGIYNIDLFVPDNEYVDRIISLVNHASSIRVFVLPSALSKIKFFRRYPEGLLGDLLLLWSVMYSVVKSERVIISVSGAGRFLGFVGIMGRKAIYVPHSLTRLSGNIIRAKTPYIKLSLIRNASIVCVSDYQRNNLSEAWQIDGDHMKVIRNTVKTPRLYCSLLQQRNPIVVITVGNLIQYKHPDLWVRIALRCLRKNDKLHFVWYGDGDLLDVTRKSVPEQYRNAIKFLGYTADVDSKLIEADIYLHTSTEESFSLATLQAMSYKLPVVHYAGTAIDEMVTQKYAVSCKPLSISQCSNAILALASTPSKRTQMGKNAYNNYKQRYHSRIWKQAWSEMLGNASSDCSRLLVK